MEESLGAAVVGGEWRATVSFLFIFVSAISDESKIASLECSLWNDYTCQVSNNFRLFVLLSTLVSLI